MIVTLAEVKQYLRLEEDFVDDDTLIQTLIGGAEGYLQNATGQLFDETNSLAQLLCLVLIADWHEHRDMVGKVSEEIRYTVQSIMSQLQYAYPAVKTAALPDATVGAPYSACLKASGGCEPYTWAIKEGPLPEGLALDARKGIVSGTPTAAGEAKVTIELTDSSPVPKVVKRPVSLVVVEP